MTTTRPLPAVAQISAATPDPAAAKAVVVPRQQWMEAAACQYTDPEVFFPLKGDSSLTARRVCHRCPVLASCLQWALATGEDYGVLGGQSVRDRRALAAAMRNWADAAQLPCPSRGPVPPAVQQAYLAANAAVAA